MATTTAQRMKQKAHDHFFAEDYNAGTLADIERARYWTESFKQTEGQSRVIRVAKALANYLDSMSKLIEAVNRAGPDQQR